MGPARRDSRRRESRTPSGRERPQGSWTAVSGRTNRCGGRLISLRVIEAVAATVDDLLDREQRDEDARDRDRSVEGGDRRIGGQTEAAEPAKEIEIAKVDQAARDRQDDEARRELDDETRRAVHRFRERGQVEVIVAPRRRRRSGEDSVDEERRRDLLEPEPGVADRARQNVEQDGERKAEQREPAYDHQAHLELVEDSPFQMTLPVEHELVGDRHRRSPHRSPNRSPMARQAAAWASLPQDASQRRLLSRWPVSGF